MVKLDERELTRSYIGRTCCAEKLAEIFNGNGTHHVDMYENGKVHRIPDCAMYISDCHNYTEELRYTFGITPTLFERWGFHGIEFDINIFLKDGKIAMCSISKCKCTYGHGRGSGHSLSLTQQELRIFQRVMDCVTIECSAG